MFERNGLIRELLIDGRTIRSTSEHPYYRQGDGWVPLGSIRAGDRLLGEDGEWLLVEGVRDTGAFEPVYNVRVADFHTYFVGCDEWGFAVWAHNLYEGWEATLAEASVSKAAAKDKYFRVRRNLPEEQWAGEYEAYLRKQFGVPEGQPLPAKLKAAVDHAILPEPQGGQGGSGRLANEIGKAGEVVTAAKYGPKNNEIWAVEGYERGAKPDHVVAMDVRTRRPSVVVETKNHQEYYLSSQIERYLRLVGREGKVIIAVPESGATIFNSLKTHPQIQLDYVLPPKGGKK